MAHPALASCGLLDFTCQISQSITGWFAGLVQSAVNPLLAIIGNDLLSTPQPGSFPAVIGMWGTSLTIADAAYVLLVLAGGILVMGYETVQTSLAAGGYVLAGRAALDRVTVRLGGLAEVGVAISACLGAAGLLLLAEAVLLATVLLAADGVAEGLAGNPVLVSPATSLSGSSTSAGTGTRWRAVSLTRTHLR